MKYLINLLPEKKKNVVDQIIYFSVHYLRYILVITQFVAICVFFFRFKVDQDIVDLKEQLNQKESIVTATEPLITHIDSVDKKIQYINTIIQAQNQDADALRFVFSSISNDITVQSLEYGNKTIVLNGFSSDSNAIDALNQFFITDGTFKDVKLTNVNKSEEQYSFDLTLSLVASKKTTTTDQNTNP
ncbi:hypothetical protein KC726_00880 [Candidatus Woesebacteria bacterium]|nr:hypothetical protein [Candidatus Woesebacteria bacterium]